MATSSLSDALRAALQARKPGDGMLVHADQQSLQCTTGVVEDRKKERRGPLLSTITKQRWTNFLHLWLECLFSREAQAEQLSAFPNNKGDGHSPPPASSSCRVAVTCADGLYAALVEGSCLFMGIPFCVLNPADPPCLRESLRLRAGDRAVIFTDADVASLLSQVGEAVVAPPLLPVDVTDQALAYVVFTSGSTGALPKAVATSRSNLLAYYNNFCCHQDGLGIDSPPSANLVFLTLSTPFFDPSIGDLLCMLLTPAARQITVPRSCLTDGSLTGLVSGLLSLPEVRPTHVVTTPAVWGTLTCESLPSSEALRVFLGGERMSQALLDRWASEVKLYNIYGTTEGTIYQSCHRVRPGEVAGRLSCGGGVGTVITLAQMTEKEREMGMGEVVLSGPQIASYLGETEGESSAGGATPPMQFSYCPLTGVRQFHTGDVGVWEVVADDTNEEEEERGGELERQQEVGDRLCRRRLLLLGRRDWMVKLNGQRICIEMVEAALQEVDLFRRLFKSICCGVVRRAAATKDEEKGEGGVMISVYAVMRQTYDGMVGHSSHHSLLQSVWRGIAKERLPIAMVPSLWVLSREAIPLTPTGKWQRQWVSQRLQEELMAHEGKENVAADDGGDSSLRCLRSIPTRCRELYPSVELTWRQFFGRARSLPPTAHFFHLGGDSLGALKLSRSLFLAMGNPVEAIGEDGRLPQPFDPTALWRYPRLVDYACMLVDAAAAAAGSASPSGSSDTVPPVPTAQATGDEDENEDDVLKVLRIGCPELLAWCLQHDPTMATAGAADKRRAGPLHSAVQFFRSAVLQQQEQQETRAVPEKEEGDDVEGEEPEAHHRYLQMITLLIQHGAKVTATTPDGVTPAHLAAAIGGNGCCPHIKGAASFPCDVDTDQTAALRLLLTQGTPHAIRDHRGQTLLHAAARAGDIPAATLLLDAYHGDPWSRDKWQRTPCHWAALHSHTAMLELLLSYMTKREREEEEAAARQESMDSSSVPSKRRRKGSSSRIGVAHYEREARKRTHLKYETVLDVARRVAPENHALHELCGVITEKLDYRRRGE